MKRLLKSNRLVLAVAALLLSVCQPAFAEKRVALVLGNANYQNVAPLPNPGNDSAKMAATLKEAGFDVVDSRRDLSAAETRRALRDFADRARDADIAVVYYAGHGIEVDGGNYLIPVDARLERDTDVYDEALSLDRILIAIEPAKKLRLVILDACRDNPFSRSMKRTVASRAIGQGLAKVEPTSPNVLIAYSAKAGSTAADGDGTNSPFTVALSKHLTKPGLDVRRAFGFVRDEVLKTTGNRQEPFVYGSLGGEDVALVPAPSAVPPVAAAAPAPVVNPQAEARRDYELALQIGNKSALNAFLAQYPDGFYASLAKLQLDKIAAEETRVAATEKARLTEQERARLAAEGAQKNQQAKADADAKAAEQARLAAEKAKQVAQDQAAAAEQKRLAAEKMAADKTVADKDKAVNLAALNAGPPQADVTKSVQAELRRVGCHTGAADGDWNSSSQRSLTQFNRYAGTRFDAKVA
ncbi:MAG: caspase family protein, partial [bacterium]|nr:caspase family protein [bacterium]